MMVCGRGVLGDGKYTHLAHLRPLSLGGRPPAARLFSLLLPGTRTLGTVLTLPCSKDD